MMAIHDPKFFKEFIEITKKNMYHIARNQVKISSKGLLNFFIEENRF